MQDFYYGTYWTDCSAAIEFGSELFNEFSSIWNEMDRNIIKFMKVNSVAIGLWCYYQHVRHMVRKCKLLLVDELSIGDISSDEE